MTNSNTRENLFQQLRNPNKLVIDGWYDWFCKDSSLHRKGESLIKKVQKIAFSQRFDGEKVYVFFKNNCPMSGKLYDDFRIVDIETENVLYTVVPKSGFTIDKGAAQVFGRENDFSGPLVEGTMKDVYAFFEGDDSVRCDRVEPSNVASFYTERLNIPTTL